MRNVSKILSVLTLGAAMVCVSGTAFAADGDKPAKAREGQQERARDRDGKGEGEGRRERPEAGPRGDRLMQVLEELKLTDAQKEQLKAIRDGNREKREALMKEIKDLPPEERRAKMGAFMKEVHGQIEGILTDDQKAILKEKMAERPRDGEGPRGNGPRDGEGPRKGPRDGDEPRKGPRDGEGKNQGPRDGDQPRQGPRDGDKPRNAPEAD
jgi:Spy/CpxP family protein refolding chaperone